MPTGAASGGVPERPREAGVRAGTPPSCRLSGTRAREGASAEGRQGRVGGGVVPGRAQRSWRMARLDPDERPPHPPSGCRGSRLALHPAPGPLTGSRMARTSPGLTAQQPGANRWSKVHPARFSGLERTKPPGGTLGSRSRRNSPVQGVRCVRDPQDPDRGAGPQEADLVRQGVSCTEAAQDGGAAGQGMGENLALYRIDTGLRLRAPRPTPVHGVLRCSSRLDKHSAQLSTPALQCIGTDIRAGRGDDSRWVDVGVGGVGEGLEHARQQVETTAALITSRHPQLHPHTGGSACAWLGRDHGALPHSQRPVPA